MAGSRQISGMLLGAVLCGCLIYGQTRPAFPEASTNSTTRAIDEFAASLPVTMTPVVSPSVEVISNGKPLSSWREYRNDVLGFSFKYAPTYERSATGPGDHFGVDCSSRNTVCLGMRREGGREESFAVETTFSVTVTDKVSVRSCLSPADAFRDVPFSGKTAQSLAQLDRAVFRKSDCGGAAAGTGVDCSRYDIFANHKCYELISQLAASCGGTTTAPDQEACGAEGEAQDKLLKATLATFKFTTAIDAVDPRHPIANEIAYNYVSSYVRQTIENNDITITFECPKHPNWKFVDSEFQHALVGTIPVGGAQVSTRDFVSIAFNPRVYDTAKYFIKTSRMGPGWSLNGNYRYPKAPRAVWRVSAGPYASGYLILEYEATGNVGGTIALDINKCNTPSCIPIPGDLLVFQFIDLNSEIAKRFLSSLQIRINGTTDTTKLGERLNSEAPR